MQKIDNIEIKNFKSIRHQKIEGCKRINVFIGYPNVGKSNSELAALKSLSQRNDQRFKLLFQDMLQNEKCDEIITLRNWLLFLKKNHYDSNLDLL